MWHFNFRVFASLCRGKVRTPDASASTHCAVLHCDNVLKARGGYKWRSSYDGHFQKKPDHFYVCGSHYWKLRHVLLFWNGKNEPVDSIWRRLQKNWLYGSEGSVALCCVVCVTHVVVTLFDPIDTLFCDRQSLKPIGSVRTHSIISMDYKALWVVRKWHHCAKTNLVTKWIRCVLFASIGRCSIRRHRILPNTNFAQSSTVMKSSHPVRVTSGRPPTMVCCLRSKGFHMFVKLTTRNSGTDLCSSNRTVWCPCSQALSYARTHCTCVEIYMKQRNTSNFKDKKWVCQIDTPMSRECKYEGRLGIYAKVATQSSASLNVLMPKCTPPPIF